MSQYPPTPPSYGGAPGNPLQWPPTGPGLPHPASFQQPASNNYQQVQENTNRPFDYAQNEMSFNANARLPGLGTPGATGFLPPQSPFPFMGSFPPMPFPPAPFPGAQLPPPGTYQPIPLPVPQMHTPSQPATNDVQPHNGNSIVNNTQTHSVEDIDREEGELSDQEAISSRPVDTLKARVGQGNPAHRSAVPAQASTRKWVDMEEGEASSVASPSSSRESGSPYNPELSIDAAPAVPTANANAESGAQSKLIADSLSERASFLSTPKTDNIQPGNKSPAQLRVQAQGALLSLAPHNIRYHELVAEGINPSVLQRLYEGVGIKITSPQPDASASSESTRASSDAAPATKSPKLPEAQQSSAVPRQTVSEGPSSVEAAPSQSQPSAPTQSSKPMERKEVIARMLAAKAAKASGAKSVSPQSETAAPAPPTIAGAPGIRKGEVAPSSEESTKEKEVRVKEKNKAQTELARQRIEQLKKQGLVRAQQKAQADAISENAQSKGDAIQDSATPSGITPIQHPLPERPPEPETQAPASIPGLFMMETAPTPPQDSFVTPVHGLLVDSTPQPKTSHRKRPRASDFDEPVSLPKRSLSNGANHTPADEKLIIDISDDEMYEDEDDSMDIDESPGSTSQDADQSFRAPQRSMSSSSQLYSSSATPQHPRNNHPEDLKKRDLEIQAMYRRIAELEQRKKAKQTASRTQSPRGIDSVASTPGHVSNVDVDISDAPELPVVPAMSDRAPSAQSNRLSSLRPDELEHMKLKLLRKQEIESGIPVLDAEIQRSEARLSGLKDEEEHVLLEITKGKQGRQQLLQELSSLDFELNGLTLREVEEELHKVKNNEQQQVPDDGPVEQQPVSSAEESVETEHSEPKSPAHTDATVQELAVDAHVPAINAPEQATAPIGDNDTMGEADSSSDVSTTSSESEGSAMSESSDSDSDSDSEADSEESDLEQSEQQTPSATTPAATVDAPPIQPDDASVRQDQPSQPSGQHTENRPVSLPERPAFTNVANVGKEADGDSRPHEQDVEKPQSRPPDDESDSEAYEPPEPEDAAEASDSDYTPPSNPPSPGPVDAMETSVSSPNQDHHAGELLTGKIQEVDSSGHPQNGILENPPMPEGPERKFTPYVSPLKNFKAYRYHPNYTSGVKDGYRSLTYSHDIDAMKYLCPFEAAGGVCNDRSCEFQHFRDMTLSDDKILVQMGSLREGNTPEEKDNYVTGLKEMVNELRRDKVKDFNTVATEIAAYRRRYLQDPSRILPL